MNTSAIPASALATSGASSKPQQPDASKPDVPFKQVLKREVADRHKADNTNAPKTTDAVNARKQTADRQVESVNRASPRSPEESNSKDTASISDAENNSTAEQLLNMAAQFSPVPVISTAQNATPADPNAATIGTPLSAKSELQAIQANPNLAAESADLKASSANQKPPGFEDALNALVENNQGQGASKAGEKSALTGTILPQEQPSAKMPDSIPLPSSAILAAEKTQDARPDLSASLAPLQQAIANSAQTPLGHVADRITPHVGTPAWNQSIGQKLVWMIGSEQQSASLTLNPPDLGPLQVVLSVSSTQANASFYSSQPEVRQALEAALPKLREMLGDAGIQLGQANVSAGTPQQQGSYGEQQASSRGISQTSDRSLLSATTITNNTRIVKEGLIDTFA